MNRILIVEDEIAICNLIKYELEMQGYKCDVANDGQAGANFIEKNRYDLILLDMMLPKIEEFELLEYVKQQSKIPIILITAKGQMIDKMKVLQNVADDFITKPFEIQELTARVEAVLRRYNKGNDVHTIEDVVINIVARTVKKKNVDISLTPKEFDLLILLIQNKNIVLYKETMYEKIWGEELEFETRTLDLHIQRLRKKLDWKDKIKTIYKIGYMLEDK